MGPDVQAAADVCNCSKFFYSAFLLSNEPCRTNDTLSRTSEHPWNSLCEPSLFWLFCSYVMVLFLQPVCLQAVDLSKPIDKRIYKGTQPTCHDFNQYSATAESVALIVGFSAGQVQYLDPIKKETSKLFNEEVFYLSMYVWAYLFASVLGKGPGLQLFVSLWLKPATIRQK